MYVLQVFLWWEPGWHAKNCLCVTGRTWAPGGLSLEAEFGPSREDPATPGEGGSSQVVSKEDLCPSPRERSFKAAIGQPRWQEAVQLQVCKNATYPKPRCWKQLLLCLPCSLFSAFLKFTTDWCYYLPWQSTGFTEVYSLLCRTLTLVCILVTLGLCSLNCLLLFPLSTDLAWLCALSFQHLLRDCTYAWCASWLVRYWQQ